MTAAALLIAAVVIPGCHNNSGNGAQQAALGLGAPLAGLDPFQEAAFVRGKEVFDRQWKPSEGLGPFYNALACGSCHSQPATGGSAPIYRNFYIAAIGIPGFQFAIPGLPSVVVPAYGSGFHALATFGLEGGRTRMVNPFPGSPFAVTQRNALPTFGVGLFEFISDDTIASNADPNDTILVDGISGRFNTVGGAIGRFGVKAQANNIEGFTRAPLQNQMGITSNPFRGILATVSLSGAAPQVSADPFAPLVDSDGVPDPEISEADLGDLIAFSSFLAPPVKKPFNTAAVNGELLFGTLGCAKCHIPSLPSSQGDVEAFTDLLLHDMGPALADGISMGVPQTSTISPGTTENEFRTQPLWGVSLHAPFLHDGRADTLDIAIRMHDGEALAIRTAYEGLSATERNDVIAFLEHL